jgi:uncharacterized protein (TIGR02646 family)
MRNVERFPGFPEPPSLQKYKKHWTEALMEKIKECKKTGKKVPDNFYNKYNKKDILEALQKMYGRSDFCYCCYCESIINDVSFEQIEHRMPKKKSYDKYPESTYDWDNLHLACEKCNNSKRNQYDEKFPILDATKDIIEEHLGYKLDEINGVYRETLSKRGNTTVEHADLDRPPLRKARLGIWISAANAIQDINRRISQDDPRANTALRMLRDKCSHEHGSLIKFLINQNIQLSRAPKK